MPDQSDIDALVALQAERSLGYVHLVEIRDDGFVIAHTDYERVSEESLEDCPLHLWLVNAAGPPLPLGTYTYLMLDDSFDLLPDLP